MRRKLTAIVIAVFVFSLLAAAAASLSVTSADLGAGVTTTASCDTDGVAVDTWVTSYNGTEYRATGYTVSGIAAACAGQNITVDLLDSGGVSLDQFTGVVGGASVAVAGIDVSAAAVEGVAVVIAG